MIDLNSMSMDELRKLRKDVDKAIESFKEREQLAALAAVESIARERGFSLGELARISVKRSRGVNPPKYANPEDPRQTWTGRGRRPKWVETALESGKTMEDLAIAR